MDHIIGCGQRNGIKYFLVRFKGSLENEVIVWNAAKEYAVQVMEFFGSRLKWSPLENIVDDAVDEQDSDDHQHQAVDEEHNLNASANLLDNPINQIHFAQ